MEMSTLTTITIQEQFMSEQPELNNNDICANDTSTSKFICTSTQESSKIGEGLNPVSIPESVPVEPAPFDAPVESDTNTLLLPPLIEMPTDPNQGNEMLQNLPKDTSISFPDVSAQTLDENQDVKIVLPDAADPTSLLNPNAASLPSDPLRTPPRPMIEDRTTVTDQFIAVAPPAASAPPVVTVEPSELEPEPKERDTEPTVELPATSVKQEPNDSSMTVQMEKFDEKVEGLIRRSKLNGPSPNSTQSPDNVHQSTHRRISPVTTNLGHDPGYHHHQQQSSGCSSHQTPVSRPPVSHPYGGHHYFPRAIPSHVSDHPSAYMMETSHGIHHHHRYSSSIGQVPFHHQSSISEDDDREEGTPSPDSKDSALNLAMNAAAAYHQQSQHQQHHHHYSNIATISQPIQHNHSNEIVPSQPSNQPSFSQHLQQQHPGTVHHHPVHQQHQFQAHHHHQQSLPQHHHFPAHHQLPPGRNPYHSNPPPPLISSLASSMSRNSTNSHTYNQANSSSNEPFHMMGQHLPPPNHHPFADPTVHGSMSHQVTMGPGYRIPTSIPVSVVTSLSDIRRKQLVNQTQYNTLVNGSSVQEYKLFVDQNKSDNMRSSITVKTRTALPSSVISTGTRSSARTNTVTGVHEGGAGGITGSNDLVSVISGQPNGPAGGVSCTPLQSGSDHHRLATVPLVGPKPPPVASNNPGKPFKCPLCEKELASKNVYQLHLRSHTGERPFACNLCGNAFSQKTSLTRHMRSHTGERPYPCNQCDKRFADKERIKIHMRTHTGEKPFACEVCKKTFSQKSTVKRHMSVHTGAKPFKCPQCDKGFANRGNLTAHTKTHQSQVLPTVANRHVTDQYTRASGSCVARHPSGSSSQSLSSTESEPRSVVITNGSIVVESPSCHRQEDTSSSFSSAPPSSVMLAK